MLEARLQEAGTLKKLLDAIKELVTDANFECNEEGINLQAMDNSHVALVAVKFQSSGFKKYRCDRPMPLGVNLTSLTKVLKCAKDDDSCTLTAGDGGDVLNLIYEAKNSDRIAEYEMKLMDIDADSLAIPDTDYDARVTMPSSEFTRIVRDLTQLGESVRIDVNKEGVRFASDGESANGNVLLKQTEAAKAKYENYLKEEENDENDEEDKDEDEPEEVDENGDVKPKIKKEKTVKKEKVKKEKNAEDEDVEMVDEDEGEGDFKPDDDNDEDNDEEANDEDEEANKKKRKKAPAKARAKPAKKARTKKADDDNDGPSGGVSIDLNSAVSLTFSLKYLVNFSKSASLSETVQLMMSNDVPLLVSYHFGVGHIRYYLAPKIGDD